MVTEKVFIGKITVLFQTIAQGMVIG